MQKEDDLNEYFTNLTHKSEKICYTTIRNKIFLKLIREKGCPVDGSIYERAAKLGPVSRAAELQGWIANVRFTCGDSAGQEIRQEGRIWKII